MTIPAATASRLAELAHRIRVLTAEHEDLIKESSVLAAPHMFTPEGCDELLKLDLEPALKETVRYFRDVLMGQATAMGAAQAMIDSRAIVSSRDNPT